MSKLSKFMLSICTLFLIVGAFAASDPMEMSIQTSSGDKYILVPYRQTVENKLFLQKLLTTSRVYENLRDGKPWTKGLIEKKDVQYLAQADQTREIMKEPSKYDPETYGTCWLVFNSQGERVGRGGFQPEDSVEPFATEVYLALLPECHGKGIGTEFVRDTTKWFRAVISQNAVLRGLAMPTNGASQKMLMRNGYEKVFDKKDKPLETTAWDMTYEVFENKPTQE